MKFIWALIAAILIVVTVAAVHKAWRSKDDFKPIPEAPTTQSAAAESKLPLTSDVLPETSKQAKQ